MSTTFPRRSAADSGGELSHTVAPPREGNSPSIGKCTSARCLAASKSLCMFMLYAFHKLGCAGEVPLHYAGRRHQSAYVSPNDSRSDPLTGVAVHRLADGGDRGQDHVGDDLGLRDHDHVGAL